MKEVLEWVGAREPDYFEDESHPVVFDADKAREGSLIASMGSLLSVGGYAPMNNATRHFLEMFYKPYNAQLKDLLGEEWEGIWSYE